MILGELPQIIPVKSIDSGISDVAEVDHIPRERQQRERASSVIGIALAVTIHVLACLLCVFTGFKYLYPPPPETTFLLDFTEENEEQFQQHFRGIQPETEEIDRTKPVELVQRSEAPYQTTAKNNLTPATKPDTFGDVETPAVEQEQALDPRAAFPGMSKKDTSLSAPHGAREAGLQRLCAAQRLRTEQTRRRTRCIEDARQIFYCQDRLGIRQKR